MPRKGMTPTRGLIPTCEIRVVQPLAGAKTPWQRLSARAQLAIVGAAAGIMFLAAFLLIVLPPRTSPPANANPLGKAIFAQVDHSKGPEGQRIVEREGVCKLYQSNMWSAKDRSNIPYYSREHGFERNGQWVHHGLVTVYWDKEMTTKYAEGTFNDGQRHGKWIYWQDNGNEKAEHNFKMGKRHGAFIDRDWQGKKTAEIYYEDDRPVAMPSKSNRPANPNYSGPALPQGSNAYHKGYNLGYTATKALVDVSRATNTPLDRAMLSRQAEEFERTCAALQSIPKASQDERDLVRGYYEGMRAALGE